MIEDHHDKLEEDFQFPCYEKAGKPEIARLEQAFGLDDLAKLTA